MKRAILIHGGAGRVKKELWPSRIEGLREAVLRGYEALSSKNDSIEAVVEAVAAMEDSGLFNAGRGSTISFKGTVEMDAAVMDWRSRFGAVGGVPNIRNPIRLARYVMEETPHRLIVGLEARNLAYRLGFKEYSMEELTGLRRIEEYLGRVRDKPTSFYGKLFESGKKIFTDTVGAVAVDSQGRVAAAVSTGGLLFKYGGRVGDSAVLGAGIMANAICAAVATGIGEYIMDSLLSYRIVEYRRYMSLEAACRKAMGFLTRYRGMDTAGVICIDRFGNLGWMHNTEMMGRAYMADGMDSPDVDMVGEGFIKV